VQIDEFESDDFQKIVFEGENIMSGNRIEGLF